jgi:hypothetical protein
MTELSAQEKQAARASIASMLYIAGAVMVAGGTFCLADSSWLVANFHVDAGIQKLMGAVFCIAGVSDVIIAKVFIAGKKDL